MVELRCLSAEGMNRRYAVYSEGQYVGGITVYPIGNHPEEAAYGILICRRFRRRGLAGEALNCLFQELAAQGCRRVRVRIEARNAASLALHRSLGFVQCPAEEPGICCLTRPLQALNRESERMENE